MGREDLAGLPPGSVGLEWVLTYAFATSGKMAEEVLELAQEAGLTSWGRGREPDQAAADHRGRGTGP